MKGNNSDEFSEDGVVQRLNFATPEKQKSGEWRLGPIAEDYTRKLFESNKKGGEVAKNIVLVMPFFEEKDVTLSSR
jgi:hypothetical protein